MAMTAPVIDAETRAELSVEHAAERAGYGRSPIDRSSGVPHDPIMEERIGRLEQGMSDVRSTLARMEPMLVRMDERSSHAATKAELVGVQSDLKAGFAGAHEKLGNQISALQGELTARPTTLVMVSWMIGVGVGIAGLVVAILRWVLPVLAGP